MPVPGLLRRNTDLSMCFSHFKVQYRSLGDFVNLQISFPRSWMGPENLHFKLPGNAATAGPWVTLSRKGL